MVQKACYKNLTLTLGFIVFLLLTFIVSWHYFEKQTEEDVSNINPEYFPVVVITSDKSEVVLTKNLEEYKQSNPNHSFLIPNGKEKLINEQLNKDQINRGGKGIPRVSAETIADEKQLVELEIIGDGLFLSRYEATDKEIKPVMLKMSGPGFVFLPCVATFIIGSVGFVLLKFILRFMRKRKRTEMV